MIYLTKCYATVTPESAEDGDIADSGFVFEDVEYSFKELLHMIKYEGFFYTSDYPASGSPREWLETDFDVTDYRTGEETQYSLHYSRKNPAKNDKYWLKAVRFSQERN